MSLTVRSLLSALALAAACAALPRGAAAEGLEGATVIVGPCSYEHPVDRAGMIRDQHLREALLLRLRTAGFPVAHEALLPPRDVDHVVVPLARLQAVAPEGSVVIELRSLAERVDLVVHDPLADGPHIAPVPRVRPGFLDVADALVERLARARGVRPGPPLALTGGLDEGWLRDEGRLDLSFPMRLDAIQTELERLDAGARERMVAARLAVLCGLHASFFHMADELMTLRWFGRARAFAELSLRGGDALPEGALARMRRDLDLLARRYGAGEAIDAPEGGALLAEVSRILALTTLAPERIERCPEIRDLFDLLVYRTHEFYPRGSDAARWAFARRSGTIDAGLVWSKKGDGTVWFDAAQYTMQVADIDACVEEIAALGRRLGFADRFALVHRAFRETADENPWDLLDNAGAYAKGPGDPFGDGDSLVLLSLLDGLEREARSDRAAFGTRLALDLGWVIEELVSRYQEVVLIRKTRLGNVGDSRAKGILDAMLERYGRDRIHARARFPRLPALEARGTDFRRWRNTLADQAEQALVDGRTADALALVQRQIDRVESDDSMVYTTIDPREGSIALEYYLRAGKVEEGLAKIAALRSSGFSADHYRGVLLMWQRDDFGFLPPGFPWDVNTRSATDLITLQEHALRRRDWAAMVRIGEAYHYGSEVSVQCRQALGRILLGRRDDAELWAAFAHALAQVLDGQTGAVLFLPHWVAILDRELGAHPRWEAIKREQHVDERAELVRAWLTLNARPTPDDLRRIAERAMAIARGQRAAPVGSGTNALLWAALEVSHQALARHILAETDRLASWEGRRDLLDRAADLLDSTNAFTATSIRSGADADLKGFEVQLLFFMVRFGAEPARVARFGAAIPDVARRFRTRHMDPVVAAAVTSPEVLQVVLEGIAGVLGGKKGPFLARMLAPKVDADRVFEVAYASGADAAALQVALGDAHAGRSIDRMLRFFATPGQGGAWIARNAPDRDVEARWRAALAARDPSLAALVRERAARHPLPERLPDLVDFLNP